MSQESNLKAKERRDLTKGSVWKKLAIYIGPLFLASVLSLLFTTMDLFTVAHFGGGNLSSGAIGATSSLINILLTFFWGLTGGASVVIANAKGARDMEKIARAVGTCVLLTIFMGFIVLFVGTIFAKGMLQLMQTDPQLLDKASLYLTIYFIGSPFNLLYNAGASILRALGDTRRPLYAVLVGGIVNIGLNFLMVLGFNMDVAGVAIATVASQAISMIIVFIYLMKDKRLSGNFELKYLHYYKEEGKDILRIGLASGLQSLIFNITNVAIQASVNTLSVEAAVAKSAAGNIESYEYALLNSISTGCSVAVAQNYGSKNKSRIKSCLFWSIIFELVAVTALDGIFIALNQPLLSLFIVPGEATTEAANQLALNSLLIMGIPYALCGIAECCTGYLRGLKYSLVPTLVSLFCIVGIRLIFIFAMFPFEPFHNFEALIMTYPISWTACCLVYIPITIIYSKKSFAKIDNELQAV